MEMESILSGSNVKELEMGATLNTPISFLLEDTDHLVSKLTIFPTKNHFIF